MAAYVYELSWSWMRVEVAAICQILVARSRDERKHRDHSKSGHAIADHRTMRLMAYPLRIAGTQS